MIGNNDTSLTNPGKGTTLQDDDADIHAPPPTESFVLQEVMVNLPEYNRTGDPQDHLDKFYAKADLYGISDAAYCKFFWTNFSGLTLSSFNKLYSRTTRNLKKFIQFFLHQFSINRRYPKTAAYLLIIIQNEEKCL